MDRVNFLLTTNRNVSASSKVLAGDDHSSTPLVLIADPKSTDTVYIQKISDIVTTDGAQTGTFQDTAGTPIVVANRKASPGLGPNVFDFGTEGFALTPGKGLVFKNGGAAVAESIAVQAYVAKTPSTAITPNQPGTLGGM